MNILNNLTINILLDNLLSIYFLGIVLYIMICMFIKINYWKSILIKNILTNSIKSWWAFISLIKSYKNLNKERTIDIYLNYLEKNPKIKIIYISLIIISSLGFMIYNYLYLDNELEFMYKIAFFIIISSAVIMILSISILALYKGVNSDK